MSNNILYIRSGPYELNFDNYNLQEIGLGKALCNKGYNVDVMYYSKENRDQIVQEFSDVKLRILWRKGIKLLRSGVYKEFIKKENLARYDVVFVSEYSQIMSVIVSKLHPNVYLYNGPYYNLFKIGLMEKPYDFMFAKGLNKRCKKIFCKTEMAKEYIAQKGITNSVVTGVGLDSEKFDNETEVLIETENLLNKMSGKENLLYVGAISKRKNVEVVIQAYISYCDKYGVGETQLILIGKGDQSYKDTCENLIPSDLKNNVIWIDFIKNAQLKFIYESANLFLLPSLQEIFGMVLLEAMYFGLPVISSSSAGAKTLIESHKNGILMEGFSPDEWMNGIHEILKDKENASTMGTNAKNTICQKFTWEQIADKMLKNIQ